MLKRIKRLWGWFWGIHICEEFTQWEEFVREYSRPTKIIECFSDPLITEVHYSIRGQERKCTICGKIQQRELEL